MKKLFLSLLLLIGVFMTSACNNSLPLDKLGRRFNDNLDIRVADYEVILEYNDHGGFHNDGKATYGIKLKDDSVENQIKDNKNWKDLNINSDIKKIINGDNEGSSYFFDKDGKNLLPAVDNGYYLFKNTFVGQIDNYISYDRLPYNFIIGLFDTDNNVLYLCEFDS